MNRYWIRIRTAVVPSRASHWSYYRVDRIIALSVIGLGIVSLSTVILRLTPPTLAQTQTEAQPSGTTIVRPTLRLGSQGATVTELQALLKLLGFYQGTVDGVFQESTAIAVVSFQQAAGLTADGIVGDNTWNRLLPPGTTASSRASSSPATPNPAPPNPTNSTPVSPATPSPAPSNTPSSNTPSPNTVTRTPPAIATTPRPTTNTASATSTPGPVSLPTLRLGMRGPAVTRLQQRLRAIGIFNGEIDGIFGAATQTAVQSAQRRYNLTPDGVVGNATWGALLR